MSSLFNRMKRKKICLESALMEIDSSKLEWKKTVRQGLDLDYTILLPQSIANELLLQLQDSVEYYDGDLTKVKVFGRWHDIPRQQVAFGDDTLKYSFSGNTLPAKPWTPQIKAVRDLLHKITGIHFNFVLVNRYRNGNDHIGEHKDGEKDLDRNTPIASLSLGQERDFILKHEDVRKKPPLKKDVPLVKINLQHGSLLLMNPPTNEFWYHSLPSRKHSTGVRINLTFRKIIQNTK